MCLFFAELKLEKKVLWERCRTLKSENMDLNKNAERLSLRLSVCSVAL